MPIDIYNSIVYKNIRKAYIASYLVNIITSLLDEIIQLQSFVLESKSNLKYNTNTLTFQNQLQNLELQINNHINLYQNLYEKSKETDYRNIETTIQNNILPLISSNNYIFHLLNEYFLLWKNELTFDNFQYYHIDDLNNLIQSFTVLNQYVSLQILNIYKILQNFYSFLPFHFLIIYYRSKLYVYTKLNVEIDNLISILKLETRNLINGLSIILSDFNQLQSIHNQMISLFLQIENIQKNLFNYNTSTTSLYPFNTELLTIPINDTKTLATIYADEKPPISDIDNNCWRYTNNNVGKINWYFANFTDNLSFQNLYSIFFLVKFRSTQSKPFLTLYTQRKFNQLSGWYGKRKNYTNYNPNIDTWYLIYLKQDPVSFLPQNLLFPFEQKLELQYQSDGDLTFHSNVGDSDILSNDNMFLISLSSDSSASVNKVDFSLIQFGYVMNNKNVIIHTTNSVHNLLN